MAEIDAIKTIINEAISNSNKDTIKYFDNKFAEVVKKFDDLEKSLNYMGDELQDTKKKTETNEAAISHMQDLLTSVSGQYSQLENRISNIEDYSRIPNLIMAGIVKNENESDEETLIKAVKKNLGMDITGKIEMCHPLGAPNEKGKVVFVCKFYSRKTKLEILASKRALKKQLAIGIFEHLGPIKQKLFNECRKIKDDIGYRHVYVTNQKIFMRETDKSKPMIINSYADLKKLMK